MSIIGCPTAHALGDQAAPAWAGLYNHGVAIMPKVAGLVATSFLYAAYTSSETDDGGRQSWKGYTAAAVLAVAIVPYTIALMRPTNDILLSAAAGTANALTEVRGLIDKWAVLNLIRSTLPLASAVVGFLTFEGHI